MILIVYYMFILTVIEVAATRLVTPGLKLLKLMFSFDCVAFG